MNKLPLGLFAGLFALSCNDASNISDSPKNTDIILQNLKGKIQQVEEVTYTVDSLTGKTGEVDTCCIGIDEYDEKGYITKYYTKDSKGTMKEEFSYTRYDNGILKGWTIMADGKQKSRFTIHQASDGGYGDAENYDSTDKLDAYYTEVTDNEYNQVTGWKRYKADSTLHSSGSGVYDKNIFISFTRTDSTGKVDHINKVKNDENGRIIEQTITDVKKDTTTTKVSTFKYDSVDEKGNWTQRTEFNEKGKPVKVVKRVITYYKN